jgi:hypothetical protein
MDVEEDERTRRDEAQADHLAGQVQTIIVPMQVRYGK